MIGLCNGTTDSLVYYKSQTNILWHFFFTEYILKDVLEKINVIQDLWFTLTKMERVVLVDNGTSTSNHNERSHVCILYNIISRAEPDGVEMKNPIVILDGGMDKLISLHPELSTNNQSRC